MSDVVIGIRREDKHEWERRVPLTPSAVAQLVAAGIEVVVQPSSIRAFGDAAYARAGARIDEDVSGCALVLAVKEIPQSLFREGGAYVFFSHTIKGQAHNMSMLRRLSELGCTLIDYERIVDDENRRLVFFGRHAGLAGMVDTLWVTARRLAARGVDTALRTLELTHRYTDLDAVRTAVARVSEAIRAEGLPEALAPFVVGIAGYGNVSRGAQEIVDLLPVETVQPHELAALTSRGAAPRDRVFKVVFHEQDLVARGDEGTRFELQHYYDHPQAYRGAFERHLAHLSVLVNAIYWTRAYPRLVSKASLRQLFGRADGARLITIGDIGCDIDGAVECTVKATTPDHPAYIYDPETDTTRDDWEGPGVAMMTTDCLPCELPKEASEAFTAALEPFVAAMASADYTGPLQRDTLPDPIRRAVILWRGELTQDYRYLEEHITGG